MIRVLVAVAKNSKNVVENNEQGGRDGKYEKTVSKKENI